MKKIVLSLAVALMGITMMNAQPPQGGPRGERPDMDPNKMVEHRVDQLDQVVGLSETQKTEITRIYKDEMEAMKKEAPSCEKKETNKGENPDEAAMKAHGEKMKAQHEATEAKVQAVLNADQQAKYSEFKQNHPQHGGHHGKPGPQMGQPGGNGGGCCCCCNKGGGPRPEGPAPEGCPSSSQSNDK